MPRVLINVGGKQFECHSNTLKKIPETLLADLDETSVFWDEERKEYFFDRDPKMFSFILNFYRFGELHLPHNVCGPAMRRELEFFGVQDKSVAHCCWKAYNSYSDQERAIQMIEKAFSGDQFSLKKDASKLQRTRYKLWQFLEDPTTSKAAKIYSWIFGVLLIITIIITILSSRTECRVKRNVVTNLTSTNPKIILFVETEPHLALEIIDKGLLCFFTCELFMRFLVSPSKKIFLKGFFNLIDIVAVLPKWVYFVIERVYTNREDDFLIYVSAFLAIGEVFRVLRILKLAKNFTGLKVLILTVRASLTEMSLVLFIILTGSMIFAVLIFFSEFWVEDTFLDITVGSYWALITMTTVGYGDIYPRSLFGRLVAVVCGITGIFCTGLPIPIIANNFDLYYSYARIRKAMLEREKENRQNIGKRFKLGTKKAFNMAAAIATAGKMPFGLAKKSAPVKTIKEDSAGGNTSDSNKDTGKKINTKIEVPSVSKSVDSILSTRTPRDVTMTVSDELIDDSEESSVPSSADTHVQETRKKALSSMISMARKKSKFTVAKDVEANRSSKSKVQFSTTGSRQIKKEPEKVQNNDDYTKLDNLSSPSCSSLASTTIPGMIEEIESTIELDS